MIVSWYSFTYVTCILVILGVAKDNMYWHGSSFTGKIETVLRVSPQLDFELGSFGHLRQFSNAVLDFLERD